MDRRVKLQLRSALAVALLRAGSRRELAQSVRVRVRHEKPWLWLSFFLKPRPIRLDQTRPGQAVASTAAAAHLFSSPPRGSHVLVASHARHLAVAVAGSEDERSVLASVVPPARLLLLLPFCLLPRRGGFCLENSG